LSVIVNNKVDTNTRSHYNVKKEMRQRGELTTRVTKYHQTIERKGYSFAT